MFSVNVYFKVWNVVNKGKYSEVDCSSSKKNTQTGNYETDFSSKFVRFIGNAHAKNPQPNEKIKITNCGVQNVTIRNGQKEYLKNPIYLVFDFEREGDAPIPSPSSYTPNAYGGMNAPNFEELPDIPDGQLPF